MYSVPPSGVSFDHNNWYGGLGVSGRGDLTADPLLVDPGTFLAAGYKLSPSSPVINKGISLSAVTTDFLGTLRSGAYDMGAYESTPP